MRKIIYILCLPLLLLSACDVHEWPETPALENLHLRLNYDTEMTLWHHEYKDPNFIELGLGDVYDNIQKTGTIRYVIRAYPVFDKMRVVQDYTQEFVFTKSVTDGYDFDVMIELPAGNYNIIVWSDLIQQAGDEYFYNPSNFSEIVLQGEHIGNNNYRDAFRGTNSVSLISDIVDDAPTMLEINMQRPLAKYEFVTTDLLEFLDKEYEHMKKEAETRGEEPPTRIDTDDYIVRFYYSGYMPNTYNIHSDKPVDSSQGVLFESRLNVLNENEASIGFDYVFVNGVKSAVSVQVGLYDKSQRQVALTNPITVPLQRSHHTILKGSFLMQQTDGGIVINPDFDGDHNIEIE